MRFLVDIPDEKMMAYNHLNTIVHRVKFSPQDSLKLLLEDQLGEASVTALLPDDRITCRPLEEI